MPFGFKGIGFWMGQEWEHDLIDLVAWEGLMFLKIFQICLENTDLMFCIVAIKGQ